MHRFCDVMLCLLIFLHFILNNLKKLILLSDTYHFHMRYFITLYNSFIEIYYCFHIIIIFYESMNRCVISNLETLNFSVRWRNMLCMTATSLLCTKAARWGCQWMGYVACVRHAQYVSLFMQRARRVWLSRVQFLPIFLFVFLGTHNNTDDNKTTPPSLNFKQNRRHK